MKEEAAADPMFQPLMPGIKHKVAITMHDVITIEFLKCFTDNIVNLRKDDIVVLPSFYG